MQNVDVGNVLYRLTLKYISGKLNTDGTIYYNLIRYKDGIVIPLKKRSVSIRESYEIMNLMSKWDNMRLFKILYQKSAKERDITKVKKYHS